MRNPRIVGMLVLATLLVAAGMVRAADVQFQLRTLSDGALAGVPVVVELQAVNTTGTDVDTYELNDPSMARVFWTWRTASGMTREVRLRDYHQIAVPEPMFPRQVRLSPHGHVARLCTVPTPLDFPDGEAWILGVKVRDPRGEGIETAEVTYRGQAASSARAAAAEPLDPGVAQAALLEYARKDVLSHALDARSVDAAGRAAQRGDLVARLVMVSKHLRTRDVGEDWDALDAAPLEARILRNYLLLTEVAGDVALRRKVSVKLIRLTKRLRPQEPLRADVRAMVRTGRAAREKSGG